MELKDYKHKPIVFFDGDCVFCSASVQWILEHEKGADLYFAALQTDFTKAFLSELEKDLSQLPDSILFWNGEKLLTQSEAAFAVSKYLKNPWSGLHWINIFPKSFNNLFYDFIARNRYNWFGKRAACFRPSEEEKSRFLSS